MQATPPSSEPLAPGPAADWSRTEERSNRLALRVMSAVAVHGGRPLARLLLWPITAYFLLFAHVQRHHARRYLSRALGRPAGWRELWTHFHRFAATVLDRVYFLRDMRECFDLQITGTAHLAETLQAGQGAVLVGGHVGSFEALAAAGRQMGELNIAMAMYPDNARMINAALEAIAPGFQMRIIALGQRHAMLSVRDWLDGGGVVGLLADRALPGADPRHDSLVLPFLGHDAPFGLGPFRLAQLLRRPVFFMVGLYNGGRGYELRLEPLADFSTPAADAAGRDRQLCEAVQAFAARLEALCRESPYNWFNFHDFWHEDSLPPADRPGSAGAGAGRPGHRAERGDGPAGPGQVG